MSSSERQQSQSVYCFLNIRSHGDCAIDSRMCDDALQLSIFAGEGEVIDGILSVWDEG